MSEYSFTINFKDFSKKKHVECVDTRSQSIMYIAAFLTFDPHRQYKKICEHIQIHCFG